MKCDNLSPEIFYLNIYWWLLNNIFQNQRWKMIALEYISNKHLKSGLFDKPLQYRIYPISISFKQLCNVTEKAKISEGYFN